MMIASLLWHEPVIEPGREIRIINNRQPFLACSVYEQLINPHIYNRPGLDGAVLLSITRLLYLIYYILSINSLIYLIKKNH